MSQPKSVCLISGGIAPHNICLQPWRYLFEVAHQLHLRGHRTCVLTDGGESSIESIEIDSVPIIKIPSVNQLHCRHNTYLDQALENNAPDVILWHLGLPSFLHQRFTGWPDVPVVGIFPGLIYRWNELTRLGLRRLTQGFSLSAMHLLGTAIPRRLLARPLQQHLLRCLVVQTQTTADRLMGDGLLEDEIHVIPPGVDDIWHDSLRDGTATRHKLGFAPSDIVVLYFGSPAPLRGLHTLIRAVETATQQDDRLKLIILSRRRESELLNDDTTLRRLITSSSARYHMTIISGYLSPQELVDYVSASDIVALPFELVPADAPLSVLEAMALGKPVVVTTAACLPEMIGNNPDRLATPADHLSLSHALLQTGRTVRSERTTSIENYAEPTVATLARRRWKDVGAEWSELISSL